MLLFLAYKAAYLFYPDLAYTYPYISYDGFQWISDGLFYAGYNTPVTYRNPGLPIIIALLNFTGGVNLLPVLNVFLLALFFVFLSKLLLVRFKSSTVMITVFMLFFNFKIQTFFDFVLADQWAITFQTISLYFLVCTCKNAKYLAPAIVFAAVSFMFQYAIAFTFPAYMFVLWKLIRDKNLSKRALYRHLIIGMGIASIIVLPNFIYKLVQFGSPLYSSVNQFALLKLHFFGLFYYLIGFFSFFGIPFAVITMVGMFACRKEYGQLSVIYIVMLCYSIFWIFFYVWLDTRFILYMVPTCAVFFAYTVEKYELLMWFRWKDSTIQKRIIVVCMIPVLFTYGFFNQNSPFTFNILPISPQLAIAFGVEQVTKWEGNIAINIRNAYLRYYVDSEPGMSFLKYYHYKKKAVDTEAIEKFNDLQNLKREMVLRYGEQFRIKAGEGMMDDYYVGMKLQITLKKAIESLASDAPFILMSNIADEQGNELIANGKYYKIVRER